MPFVLLWAGLFAIKALYLHNLLLFLLLLVLVGLTLWSRKSLFKLFFALFAMILGVLGESLCTRAGLWVYANPSYLRLPIWLPLAWALAMVNFMELGTFLADRAEKMRPSFQHALKWFLRALILVYLIYMTIMLQNYVALILLAFLAGAAPFVRAPVHTILFMVAAVAGFSGEYMLVCAGVWHYTQPGLGSIGMPVSLPIAWGTSVVLIWLAARAATPGPVPGRQKELQPS